MTTGPRSYPSTQAKRRVASQSNFAPTPKDGDDLAVLAVRQAALPIAFDDLAVERIAASVIRRGKSSNTRKAYAADLKIFARWLASNNLWWRAVAPDDLDRYIEWLKSQWRLATCRRRMAVVRDLYTEAQRLDLMDKIPREAAGLLVDGDDTKKVMSLSGPMMRRLISGLDAQVEDLDHKSARRLAALRDRALLYIAGVNGLRCAELVGLTVADTMGEEDGHKTLQIRHAKGKRQRKNKLRGDVYRAIQAWLEGAAAAGSELRPDDALFVSIHRGGHIDHLPDEKTGKTYPVPTVRRAIANRSVDKIVRARLREAHLFEGVNERIPGPHALRHTAISLAAKGGAPIETIADNVGHADIRQTRAYMTDKDHLDHNMVDFITF
jgi:integrase/recombinase XerD